MKRIRVAICFLLFFAVCLFTSCGGTKGTVIEMELTENYSDSDPFVHAKLFYVTDDVDSLQLDISLQIEGENGFLEIADRETDEVLWSDSWKGQVAPTTFAVTLDMLSKEKEYVVRFTGTHIKYAKIMVASDNSLVKERERPLKPNRVTESKI